MSAVPMVPYFRHPVNDVACPDCGAPPGQFCVGVTPRKGFGPPRIKRGTVLELSGRFAVHPGRMALAEAQVAEVHRECIFAWRAAEADHRIDREVHWTHRMGPWESEVVTILETPRFGSLRSCRACGGEQARTAAGHGTDPELRRPCPRAWADDQKVLERW